METEIMGLGMGVQSIIIQIIILLIIIYCLKDNSPEE